MMIRNWQELQPYFHQLQDLEAGCFAAAAWDRKTWEKLFENRKLFVTFEFQQGTLAGFVVVAQVGDEGELLRIGVRENWRRKGIGRRLLESALQALRLSGVATLFLEVREGNQPAVRFYRQFGCRQTGKRKNYYSQPAGDALLFSYQINQT
jgi:ribosomal-protein-alanine N-acetyltransferase